MDFSWTSEQLELRREARSVALDAVARYGRHNDSWINGYSKEFAKALAARGWIGLTWPNEHGGRGRSPGVRVADAGDVSHASALHFGCKHRRRP